MATMLRPRKLPNLTGPIGPVPEGYTVPPNPATTNPALINPAPPNPLSQMGPYDLTKPTNGSVRDPLGTGLQEVPGTTSGTGQPPMDGSGVRGVPSLPGYAANPNGLVGQDQRNIEWLLNPSFDTREVFQRSAERGVGSGTGGSGFGLSNKALMLDSEKIARAKLGHELLDPYLNRESSEKINAANNVNRLQAIAAEGASAMERLRLSEAGLSERLTSQQKADLEMQVLRGQQAADLSRLNTRGNIDQATVQSWLNNGGSSGGGGGSGGDPYASYRPPPAYNPPTPTTPGKHPTGQQPASVTSGWDKGSGITSYLTGFNSDYRNPVAVTYSPYGQAIQTGGSNPNAAYSVNPVATGASYTGPFYAPPSGGYSFNNISQLAQDILSKYTK